MDCTMPVKLSGMFRDYIEARKYVQIKEQATGEPHIVHHCEDGSYTVLTLEEHQKLCYGDDVPEYFKGDLLHVPADAPPEVQTAAIRSNIVKALQQAFGISKPEAERFESEWRKRNAEGDSK